MAPIRVNIDQRALKAKVQRKLNGQIDRRSSAYQKLSSIAEEVVAEAKSLAATRLNKGNATGNYIRNIVSTVSLNGTPSASAQAKDPKSGISYSSFIEFGTAGGGRGYIYPAGVPRKKNNGSGRVLAIPTGGRASFGRTVQKKNVKGGDSVGVIETSSYIFADRVKGQKAKRIMRDAAKIVAARHGYRVNNISRPAKRK